MKLSLDQIKPFAVALLVRLRHPDRRTIGWALAAVPLLFFLYVLLLVPFTPAISDIRKAKSEQPTRVLTADGKELAEFKRSNREWVALDGISPYVIDALIAAQRADIDLGFEKAAAIDLAGRNVLEAVKMSVNPKVIETPIIAGVAMNGIEVKAKAKVTVRANIERLVGGAGEETIIARVGEGIVTTVGSAKMHTSVLENPDSISQTILKKGLDSGTAFEILSIDIADVDVGRNVGAKLQAEQAEADKRVAQAKAEERRAFAVAEEQEMIAEVQRMRAKVVEAEAEVPLALAEALRNGNIGVMDYYKMKNIIADTEMRSSISEFPADRSEPE